MAVGDVVDRVFALLLRRQQHVGHIEDDRSRAVQVLADLLQTGGRRLLHRGGRQILAVNGRIIGDIHIHKRDGAAAGTALQRRHARIDVLAVFAKLGQRHQRLAGVLGDSTVGKQTRGKTDGDAVAVHTLLRGGVILAAEVGRLAVLQPFDRGDRLQMGGGRIDQSDLGDEVAVERLDDDILRPAGDGDRRAVLTKAGHEDRIRGDVHDVADFGRVRIAGLGLRTRARIASGFVIRFDPNRRRRVFVERARVAGRQQDRRGDRQQCQQDRQSRFESSFLFNHSCYLALGAIHLPLVQNKRVSQSFLFELFLRIIRRRLPSWPPQSPSPPPRREPPRTARRRTNTSRVPASSREAGWRSCPSRRTAPRPR